MSPIYLLYFTLGTAFIANYRQLGSFVGALEPVVSLLPEAGSLLILLAILVHLGSRKEIALAPKYFLLGGFILCHMLIGLVVNHVPPGAVVAGIRDYLRYVPIFLLPAVIKFPDQEVRRLLRFLVFLCLIQAGVSIVQAIFDLRNIYIGPVRPSDLALSTVRADGDVVMGTLSSGALVSVLLISAIAAMAAMTIRGAIQARWFFLLTPILAVPTFLNETKGSLILVVAAVVAVSVLVAKGRRRLLSIFGGILASILFIVGFATAYDAIFSDRYEGMGILEFYTTKALHAEWRGLDRPEDIEGGIPRIDSLVFAHRALSKDPVTLMLGLGIGNVSDSKAELLKGNYSDYFDIYTVDKTTYTQFLWEIGYLGLLLILLWTFIVLRDSLILARSEHPLANAALAWSVVLAVLPVALLYKSLLHSAALVVPLMFFSGYFASERNRFARAKTHRTRDFVPSLSPHSMEVVNAGLTRNGSVGPNL